MFRPCNRQKCGDARRVIPANSSLLRRLNFPMTARVCPRAWVLRLALFLWLSTTCGSALAAVPAAAPSRTAGMDTNAVPHFPVTGYTVEGRWLLPTNLLVPLFAKYTGSNVSLREIIHAASDLETEYRHEGYLLMNVAIAPKRITNGIVTLNVYPGAVAQIIVGGHRYLVTGDAMEAPTNAALAVAAANSNTNRAPAYQPPHRPATPEEMARAYAALMQAMDDASARERDRSVHVVTATTNAGPRFAVEKYQIEGNTLLPPGTIATLLTNIDGAYGTNVSLDGIRAVVIELRKAYVAHGFVTVDVSLPPQRLTNATVNILVTEGRLVAIDVKGNRYFSSNNVMRALPSLHTNMILNAQIFGAELNRANANPDRQIYSVIEPGPEPGSTALTLQVKDLMPVHAKVDFNNESTPGTPGLRLNSSATVADLWQLEHSLGFQYGFSPTQYKLGNQWNFYDQPLIANYSAYYRMPLGTPEPIENVIDNDPGTFGYNEATRKFNLPPPTSQSEANFYASRSTIDTGQLVPIDESIENIPGFLAVTRKDLQEDLTINNDIGTRLSFPFSPAAFQGGFSGGLDYKNYEANSVKTNNFLFAITTYDANGNPSYISSTISSPVPVTERYLQYFPAAFGYNGVWRNPHFIANFGLAASGNLWYDSSTTTNGHSQFTGLKSLQGITGSAESTGHWVSLNPNLSVNVPLPKTWMFSANFNGQWTSEPLITTEQFSIGGVNSVRGYHEGEFFGDTGWRSSVELQTPSHVVGMVYGNVPLSIRGSLYLDLARAYLLDPQGRPDVVELWGTGFGITAALGSHFQSRFLFSLPLIGTSATPSDQPYFNFGLTAQF
jgi:hemolysin activation/secretion protein